MRLCQFREKLNREIKELEELIEGDSVLSQQIQPTIYCIAALSRKILLDKLPKLTDIIEDINVREIPHKNSQQAEVCENIKFKRLLDAIIHYTDFRPSYLSALQPLRTRHITILGNEDTKLRSREIAIADFIMGAKRIGEDDKLIIDCLLSRAKKLLGAVIYSNSDDRFREMKTQDILIDFFDIASETEEDNWLNGKITIFHQEVGHAKLIVTQKEEIEYKVLLKKMNNEWFFTPFRQFQPYQKYGKVLQLEGKMSNRDDRETEPFMIIAEDLLDALCAMECQRR